MNVLTWGAYTFLNAGIYLYLGPFPEKIQFLFWLTRTQCDAAYGTALEKRPGHNVPPCTWLVDAHNHY